MYKRQDKERVLGYTTLGPHREDYQFLLYGRSARAYASGGEMRLLALAFKLASFLLFEDVGKDKPAILIDEALAELDERNFHFFWDTVLDTTQIFWALADEGLARHFNGTFLRLGDEHETNRRGPALPTFRGETCRQDEGI